MRQPRSSPSASLVVCSSRLGQLGSRLRFKPSRSRWEGFGRRPIPTTTRHRPRSCGDRSGRAQGQHARGDARTAARHHRLGEIDAGFGKQPLELGRRFERPVLIEQLAIGQIVRAGNMPERKPGRGSGAVPANRSGDRASTSSAELSLSSALMSDTSRTRSSVAPRREVARGAADRLAAFDRPALGLPFRQAAIEHADVVHAHDAEGPPHPRGAEQPGANRRSRSASRRRCPCCACARRTSPAAAACAAGCSWCRRSRRCRRRPRREYARRHIRRARPCLRPACATRRR